MRIDLTAIELNEDGYGVLRPEGGSGERLPALVANRPEPWRFTRLAQILDEAKTIAEREAGPDCARSLIDAMAAILDSKGDFGVVWRDSVHTKHFEHIVDRALAAEGETEIIHELESDSSWSVT